MVEALHSYSFLSLLPDCHGIRRFNLQFAELYLYRMGAPKLAENVKCSPDLDAVRELCACLEWIAWPAVPYEALPGKAPEVLHKLLGLESSETFNELALCWLMANAPGLHGPPATCPPQGAATAAPPFPHALEQLASPGPSTPATPASVPSLSHFPVQSYASTATTLLWSQDSRLITSWDAGGDTRSAARGVLSLAGSASAKQE